MTFVAAAPAGAPPVSHRYQTTSGVRNYDTARWLNPPPLVRHARVLSTGLGCLLQDGSGTGTTDNEALVELVEPAILLLTPRRGHASEWHVDGRTLHCASPVSIVTMEPGSSRWITAHKGEAVHFHFPLALLAQLLPDVADIRVANAWIAADRPARLIAEAFLTDLARPGGLDAMVLETYATLFARRFFLRAPQPEPARGGLAPWQLRRAVEYLEAHLAEDVPLRTLAALVDLSPFHFARAFKDSAGTPPHTFHLRMRLDQAKHLLESTPKTVTEIALDVGYESSQALDRLFRRSAGMSPRDWRRQKRQ